MKAIFVSGLALLVSIASADRPGASGCSLQKPKPLPRSATYCGAVGRLTEPAPVAPRIPLRIPSFDDCYYLCLNDRRCVSFGYDGKAQTCDLFTKIIEQQGFTPVSGANLMYWDLQGCFDLSCLGGKSSLVGISSAKPFSTSARVKTSTYMNSSSARKQSPCASASTKVTSPSHTKTLATSSKKPSATTSASAGSTQPSRVLTTRTASASSSASSKPPQCSNIVQDPGFDNASNNPWSCGPQMSIANAHSPPSFVSVTASNTSRGNAPCNQVISPFDFSKTYSGYFWVRVPKFNPKPPNPDYSPCIVGAQFGSQAVAYVHLYSNLYPNWTKYTFRNVKLDAFGSDTRVNLYFGLDCDPGYIGNGEVEVWFDDFFIAPDSC